MREACLPRQVRQACDTSMRMQAQELPVKAQASCSSSPTTSRRFQILRSSFGQYVSLCSICILLHRIQVSLHSTAACSSHVCLQTYPAPSTPALCSARHPRPSPAANLAPAHIAHMLLLAGKRKQTLQTHSTLTSRPTLQRRLMSGEPALQPTGVCTLGRCTKERLEGWPVVHSRCQRWRWGVGFGVSGPDLVAQPVGVRLRQRLRLALLARHAALGAQANQLCHRLWAPGDRTLC